MSRLKELNAAKKQTRVSSSIPIENWCWRQSTEASQWWHFPWKILLFVGCSAQTLFIIYLFNLTRLFGAFRRCSSTFLTATHQKNSKKEDTFFSLFFNLYLKTTCCCYYHCYVGRARRQVHPPHSTSTPTTHNEYTPPHTCTSSQETFFTVLHNQGSGSCSKASDDCHITDEPTGIQVSKNSASFRPRWLVTLPLLFP